MGEPCAEKRRASGNKKPLKSGVKIKGDKLINTVRFFEILFFSLRKQWNITQNETSKDFFFFCHRVTDLPKISCGADWRDYPGFNPTTIFVFIST